MSILPYKVSLVLLLLCSVPLFSSVQYQEIDTAEINRQTKEAYIIARRNPDLSILNSHQALSISSRASYKKGMADASLALGMAFLARYNPGDSAYYYNTKALDLYRELENYQGEARACYALAYVYSFKGNMSESERFSNLSLDNFKKAGDQRGVINAYNSLTYIARQRKDFDRARELVTEAIATARSINDTLPLADSLNSLGISILIWHSSTRQLIPTLRP
ncbi:MAG: tetratricopeptide repeat protein [Bacteroidales bacterium]